MTNQTCKVCGQPLAARALCATAEQERAIESAWAALLQARYDLVCAERDRARADAERRRAAIERYLSLDGQCDYVDGEPAICPGVEYRGYPCHWCELRAAVREAAL